VIVPSVVGLAIIPLLPMACDEPVEHVLEQVCLNPTPETLGPKHVTSGWINHIYTHTHTHTHTHTYTHTHIHTHTHTHTHRRSTMCGPWTTTRTSTRSTEPWSTEMSWNNLSVTGLSSVIFDCQ
jgi:hypothetical protein